jgi:peptidoglycan/xylan/chitin deacetylase (PgdA/CDA1 family)
MSVAANPVILTYHSISHGRSPLKIAPSLFAEQMEWLKAHARVVPLSEIVEALHLGVGLPEHTVVLTFDDGFADFHTHAAPLLRRHEFPATVFLPTEWCGRTNAWPGQPAWVEEQPLLSWEQVHDLADEYLQFGAHGVSHADLTQLTPEACEHEITESKSALEDCTGFLARFFCYPYGRWNSGVREMVARHYQGACSTLAGSVDPQADVFVLPRVDAHYVRQANWFRALFTRRFAAYIAVRRAIRRLRRQPEGGYVSGR